MCQLSGATDPACLAPGSAPNAAASWLRDTRVEMSRDKVDVAKRVVDAYNRRDVDGLFAELATPDFEWYPAIVRALDGGGGYRGREGVEKFAADTRENWEELQSLPEEFRDLGDRVLVLGRLKGRGKGSGVPVDQPFAGILDFRGDRIWRHRVYLDRAEGLRAAGLSE
jgi:ketosteroid isomerase-like protein